MAGVRAGPVRVALPTAVSAASYHSLTTSALAALGQTPQAEAATDDEVAQFQRELKTLEEYQKHLEVITELERYELTWLSLKAGESAVLQGVAAALVKELGRRHAERLSRSDQDL